MTLPDINWKKPVRVTKAALQADDLRALRVYLRRDDGGTAG